MAGMSPVIEFLKHVKDAWHWSGYSGWSFGYEVGGCEGLCCQRLVIPSSNVIMMSVSCYWFLFVWSYVLMRGWNFAILNNNNTEMQSIACTLSCL